MPFFREVHPGSEMASQNDRNKAKRERELSDHGESWRFVIGAVWCVLTPRTPRSCDGPRGSLSMRHLGLAGQQRALQARLARLCRSRRSPSDRRRTGVSPHHTMTCTDGRGGLGWRGLLRSGRVAGSREGGGSSTATGLVMGLFPPGLGRCSAPQGPTGCAPGASLQA